MHNKITKKFYFLKFCNVYFFTSFSKSPMDI